MDTPAVIHESKYGTYHAPENAKVAWTVNAGITIVPCDCE